MIVKKFAKGIFWKNVADISLKCNLDNFDFALWNHDSLIYTFHGNQNSGE